MSNPWYPFYTGDYSRDTAQLTASEHGVYRLLLDYYYSTGQCLPLCLEECSRIARAYHEHEKNAVPKILKNYFEETETGYVNHRVEKEIATMQGKQLKSKVKAQKAALARWGGKDAPSIHEALHEECHSQPQPQPHIKDNTPLTPQKSEEVKPAKKRKQDPEFVFELPDWIPKQVWDEYLRMRSKIRKPLTEYAQYLAVMKLGTFKNNGYDPVEIINTSITNGWQGLFEPKNLPALRGQIPKGDETLHNNMRAAERARVLLGIDDGEK